MFAYLANINRLSTRANLFFKSYAPSDLCEACPSVETGRHLFFDCPFSAVIWAGCPNPGWAVLILGPSGTYPRPR
jgi:hypothetical protein